MTGRDLGRNLILTGLLALAVTAGLTLFADLRSLGDALAAFAPWRLLPLAALMALNLALRFAKWQGYLNLLDVTGVGWRDSLAIFLANFLLILSPGKAGGFLKAYFLQQSGNFPVSRGAPIVLAERLTDGLGLVLMGLLALLAYPALRGVLLLTLLAILVVLLVAGSPGLVRPLLERAARVGRLAAPVRTLTTFYESTHLLLRPRPLLWATALGTASRATEGIILYLVLLGLGEGGGLLLLGQSLFIAAISNIVGVLVMMPGGLGGAEGSMAGLLALVVQSTPAVAGAATLLTRLATLWLPALLGAGALLLRRRTLLAPTSSTPTPLHEGG